MPRSNRTSSAKLIERRERWMKKLAELGPFTRGSLVTAQRGNHTAHQLTVSSARTIHDRNRWLADLHV